MDRNGIPDDNRLENLRILCPNCNATLDTHCSKNSNKKLYDEEKKEYFSTKTHERCECGRIKVKNNGHKYCETCNEEKDIKPKVEIEFLININGDKYNSYTHKLCECGKIIQIESVNCIECNGKKNRKVKDRPSLEQLKKEIDEVGYLATSRKYGVSDASIRKWIKNYKKEKKKDELLKNDKGEKYNPKTHKLCECGEIIQIESINCSKCYGKKLRKVERPPLEQLEKEVKEKGYSATGRKYGVSDNCIRKWIKNYKK